VRKLCIGFLLAGAALAQAPAASGYGKTVFFSGYAWRVKIASPPVGPGPNYFSDSANNVWTDTAGRLHMKIVKTAGKWVCAEVVLQQTLGYGTYRFYLDSPVDNLDPNVVLGLFTWNDDPAFNHRELDIEFARWGKASNPNASYTVQPYTNPSNQMIFIQPAGLPQSTHSFKWQAGNVLFESLAPTDAVIARQLFTSGVPPTGGENVRINLWLFQGKAPRKATEVVVNRFEFAPL